MTRKILIAPAYGAGWTTANLHGGKECLEYLLTYPPLIEFLETGARFFEHECEPQVAFIGTAGYTEEWDNVHPILRDLFNECKEKFGVRVNLGAAYQLEVDEVDGRVHIEEFNGYESVIEEGDRVSDTYWL